MFASTFDFGPGVISVVTVVAGVVTLFIQQRKANKELKPNGGSSMRDAVDRIEQNQVEFQGELAKIHDRLDGLEHPPVP